MLWRTFPYLLFRWLYVGDSLWNVKGLNIYWPRFFLLRAPLEGPMYGISDVWYFF